MLDGTLIVSAAVAALQSIEPLVEAMGGNPQNIYAVFSRYGMDVSTARAVFEMKAPSILVVWEGTRGGNFTAAVQIKHMLCVYVRGANQAGQEAPMGYATLWWQITNSPVNGTTQNIRQIALLPNVLLMDTPSARMQVDQEGVDFLEGKFVIPEIGD
jgi:hypothetical protein